MAILENRLKLPDLYIEEMAEFQRIQNKPTRTTTGQATFTNPRTSASYTTVGSSYDNMGENGLALLLYNVNPILKQYIFSDTDYSAIRNWSIQNEYQTPTVVSRQIRVSKPSDSAILRFKLGAEITGGNITISTDGGATELPLRLGDEVTNVTELAQGLYEVVYATSFFILRSSGGLKSFFGDGSDGTIPNLNTVTTAPNGGTVANLWDMNAGTVFTTGTLSSASDQVVISLDMGRNFPLGLLAYQVSISTGTARTLSWQYSDDGITGWTQLLSGSITTSAGDKFGWSGSYVTTSKRYWRLILLAGGSNCTLSMQGITLNYTTGDTQTTKVFRIAELSTLNGAAVIKQYTTYTLPVGYEHTTQNPCQGLIIYSQNAATVNGILDMSQKAGLAPNGNTIPMIMSNFKVTDPYGVEMFNKLTTSLRNLKGGAGGNGGYGGGYSGSTGRQTSVGIGGAGRQNLGGFGGGGSGGNANNFIGGIGGSVLNAEIGGGKFTGSTTLTATVGINGFNGSGALGGSFNAAVTNTVGTANGGGSGGLGGRGAGAMNVSSDSQYSGGFACLICGGNIVINGTVRTNGGAGSNGSAGLDNPVGGGGGGGGAGGGVISIFHKGTYTNSGTVQVNGGTGGTGGAGVGTGEAGGTGTSGGVGTILTSQL